MAGNGYFAEGIYQPLSTETWASLTNGWDTYSSSWNLTPTLPLTFTTGITDYGRIEKVLPLTFVSKTGLMTTTITYGDTIDSSGGAIDSSTDVIINVGDTVTPIKARYFQFSFSLGYEDSAGAEATPSITNIQTDLNAEKVTASFDSIESSSLGGTTGARQLVLDQPISPTVAVIQPHQDPPGYMATDYVTDGYIAVGSSSARPVAYLDKTTDPITVNIYELDTFGKTKNIDCTFDAIVVGLPTAKADVDGNIQRG